MSQPTVRVFVSGKVQGVFYRQSTVNKALELGVNGWVRNLADGRVEALLVAENTVLEAMMAWMEVGPPAAVVEQVEIVVEENPEIVDGFGIR